MTTKKVPMRLVVHELLWFIRGETTLAYLHENNVHIWDEWANEKGQLGPIYGKQWRDWGGTDDLKGTDQLTQVVQQLRHNPHGRRHIVSSWNVQDLPDMALAPCHCLFQFYVANNELSCQLYQRSADVFLGVPFNIASYALLTHMVATTLRLGVGELTITFGDVHLYRNHVAQATRQLIRSPRELPQLTITYRDKLTDYVATDFLLKNYDPYDAISAPVAI